MISDSDLPYWTEKSDSKVFVGRMSACGELQYSDICFDNAYPVYPGEVCELQDFTLEVFRGKHTFLGKKNRMSLIEPKKQLNEYFPNNYKQSDIFGGIDMITTKENTRIFINGGGPNWMFYDNIFTTMKEKSPNIVFRIVQYRLFHLLQSEGKASGLNQLYPDIISSIQQDLNCVSDPFINAFSGSFFFETLGRII